MNRQKLESSRISEANQRQNPRGIDAFGTGDTLKVNDHFRNGGSIWMMINIYLKDGGL